MYRHICLLGTSLPLAISLPGCLISSSSHTSTSGHTLASEDVRAIEIGKTTGDDLVKAYGEPISRVDRPDGSSTWRWCRTETRNSSGAVFLIFGGSSSSSATECAAIDLKNNVVAAVRRE